ncbi:MAG: NTP transferase domain-containing protein [Bacteroidota bacterium]
MILFNPLPNAAIVMPCDQPLVNQGLLEQLIATRRQLGKTLVASPYHDTVGVPILFGETLFPEGVYDIDTPEDFAQIEGIFTNL